MPGQPKRKIYRFRFMPPAVDFPKAGMGFADR